MATFVIAHERKMDIDQAKFLCVIIERKAIPFQKDKVLCGEKHVSLMDGSKAHILEGRAGKHMPHIFKQIEIAIRTMMVGLAKPPRGTPSIEHCEEVCGQHKTFKLLAALFIATEQEFYIFLRGFNKPPHAFLEKTLIVTRRVTLGKSNRELGLDHQARGERDFQSTE